MPKEISPHKLTRHPYYYDTFLPPSVENELIPLLDQVFDTEPGQAITYTTTAKRARYLAQMFMGLRNHSAIESLEAYTPDHPFHGKGLYAHVFVEAQGPTLVFSVLPEWEPETAIWAIIQVLATKQSLPLDIRPASARTLLTRLRKRYPIFNQVWITPGEPPVAHAAAPKGEVAIVDIDTDPKGPIPNPTPENNAVAAIPILPKRFPKGT
jgi:hypothetical protein